MEMVSLLTGGQKEVISFYSQSYLARDSAVEEVICTSTILKSGLLALRFSQQCLAF
jgi:hypothetical protein